MLVQQALRELWDWILTLLLDESYRRQWDLNYSRWQTRIVFDASIYISFQKAQTEPIFTHLPT